MDTDESTSEPAVSDVRPEVAESRVRAMAAGADPATRRRVLLGLLRAHARGVER
jgi:hypothetical protein